MQQLANRHEPQALPTPWVKKLFQRFAGIYGDKLPRMWGKVPDGEMHNIWAEGLAGFSGEEISKGLQACMQREWPPALPEFIRMCRPVVNPEIAYHEAVVGMSVRSHGAVGQWSHPGVFWAARRVGAHDLLNMGWQAIRGRWEHALRDVMAQGRWDPVPPPMQALPAPGGTVSSREQAQKFLGEIPGRIGLGVPACATDHRAWARRILARVQGNVGRLPSLTVVRMARNAVGASEK